AKSFGKNAVVDASLFRGRAVLSDQEYQDLYKEFEPVNLTDHTQTDTYLANVGLRINNFQLRGMLEDYQATDPLLITSFRSAFVTAKNDFKINTKLSLTPFITYTRQRPWRQDYREGDDQYFDNIASRIKAGLYGSY